MNYTRSLFFFIFFINNSHTMDVCPLWEKIRKDALNCARNNRNYCIEGLNESIRKDRCEILHEYYQRVDEARTIKDIVSLIREQALFVIRLSPNYNNQIMVQEILRKAYPRITTNDMHFCLKNLELLFTGKTTKYDVICRRMTLNAVQLFLRENMEK